MELSSIIRELRNYSVEVVKTHGYVTEIKACKLLAPKQTAFSPQLLYYVSGECPVLPENIPLTILFKDRGSIPEEYMRVENITALVPGPDMSAEILYNQIYELLLEDPLLAKSTQRLMEVVFMDLGLQNFIDVASEILGHAIYVIDNSFRILAFSSKLKTDSQLLSVENELGYITDEGVEFIRKTRLDESVRKSDGPLYFENKILGGPTLITILKIHNIEVGHVMMYQVRKPFGNFDRVLLVRLSEMISLELQKSSFFKSNRGTMYSYFLADLLDSDVYDHASVTRRLLVLGFTIKEKLFVMAVNHLSGRSYEWQLELVAEQLRSLLPGSMYVIYRGSLVMLISRNDSGITDFEFEEVQTYLKANSIIAGLSNSFESIRDMRRYYHQATKALELGKKLSARPTLYNYGDLSVMHMIDICGTSEDLYNFCSPEIPLLMEYDKQNNTDYLLTLYYFVKNSRNAVKAAAELNMHKNTILYRVDKIRSILKNDLDDEKYLMRLYLSFYVLRYMKQFDAD